MTEYKGLSLFANVGIAETYLKEIGYPIVLANELLVERAKFYQHLHQHDVISGSITDDTVYSKIISESKKQGINFILATPPCQGMSVAGKMDAEDPRNTLIIKAMQAFQELLPEFMLIENVPQMFKTAILVDDKKILIKDYLTDIATKFGYNVKFDIFDAADYGTPFHTAPKHNENHILWMKNTPTGKTAFENPIHYPKKDGRRIKGFTTTYKRIAWDKPAPTITMSNGSISSQNNVHPGRLLPDGTYSDARVLSLLEIFRLTGLPDNWSPPEWANETLIRNVIGEAIPPHLVKNIFKGLNKK